MVSGGSALCILAPLLVPEVTIPEQKMSKGKGMKTGSKEKRSILLESEVRVTPISLLWWLSLDDAHNSPFPFPGGRPLYLHV